MFGPIRTNETKATNLCTYTHPTTTPFLDDNVHEQKVFEPNVVIIINITNNNN